MSVMQVCFKYSASLCETEGCGGGRGGVWGRKRDVAWCKGAGGGSRLRSGVAENGRKVALLSMASHPEVGRTDGGGREELRGLVGWRRWGSPTATQTHRNR